MLEISLVEFPWVLIDTFDCSLELTLRDGLGEESETGGVVDVLESGVLVKFGCIGGVTCEVLLFIVACWLVTPLNDGERFIADDDLCLLFKNF